MLLHNNSHILRIFLLFIQNIPTLNIEQFIAIKRFNNRAKLRRLSPNNNTDIPN